MRRKVLRVGNSLAVTLPPDALAGLGLREGDAVDVEVSEGKIVVGPGGDVAAMVRSWTPIAATVDPDEIARVIREERDSR
jgi:antitoxin component of MazEF toxin-antitoxin module